ncbi:hypothetical protein TX23_25455 [Pseudomonas paralactis]|uniref:Uncharacterized protein n=1 Tax=Pseudomonas paralactis TaxID=1615673 RepID=A0A0R3A5F3_9PSED|nr:hypothetical protein [Pseudomonas paralactis]KRP68624.1 hypothetical protein TX23_25455 [Pseudomonas paralactis]
MALSEGSIIKLITIDRAALVLADWLNSREAAPGDIAVVERISIGEAGSTVLLLCEPEAGFLEWRASYFEAGLTYEVLSSFPHDVGS